MCSDGKLLFTKGSKSSLDIFRVHDLQKVHSLSTGNSMTKCAIIIKLGHSREEMTFGMNGKRGSNTTSDHKDISVLFVGCWNKLLMAFKYE